MNTKTVGTVNSLCKKGEFLTQSRHQRLFQGANSEWRCVKLKFLMCISSISYQVFKRNIKQGWRKTAFFIFIYCVSNNLNVQIWMLFNSGGGGSKTRTVLTPPRADLTYLHICFYNFMKRDLIVSKTKLVNKHKTFEDQTRIQCTGADLNKSEESKVQLLSLLICINS